LSDWRKAVFYLLNTPAAMLQLWVSPGACSLLPHILLYEIDADFELVVVDIVKEGGFPEKYKKVNPKQRLPILVLDDGTIITETVAISTRISQMAPDHRLLGANDLEVVRSYEWFNWLSGTFHERGFGGCFAPDRVADDESAFESVRRKSRAWIELCYADVEERLTGVHAVGNAFTAVDVFLYVIYRWGHLLKLDMKGTYPNYTNLVLEVTKRASVLKAVEKEGIPLIEDDRADSADTQVSK
jgi:glutathione S-transferase